MLAAVWLGQESYALEKLTGLETIYQDKRSYIWHKKNWLVNEFHVCVELFLQEREHIN